MSKYKNIIFDLGAVLVYFNPYEIIKDIFKDEKESHEHYVDALKSEILLDIDRGKLTNNQAIDLLSQTFERQKIITLFNRFTDYLVPLDNGVQILREIKAKGYRAYILSNISEKCYLKIKNYEFLKLCNGWIYSYQHKCAKPDREIYQKLLDLYSLEAKECLFIDDLERNIKAAKDLGIDGIVCTSHSYVREQLCTLNIIDKDYLPKITSL
jgi:HAD superfamily hydrolase (TIGR01509 family)